MRTLTRLVFLAACCTTGMLASTPAQAGRNLGIEPAHAPTPPHTDIPTMSMNERRQAIAEGDLPELLLAKPYPKSGRHFATRWYDERGQVYRSREVAMVLRAAENANINHHILWRQVCVLATPSSFGASLLLAGDQLSLGVQHYNLQQAASVRSDSDGTADR